VKKYLLLVVACAMLSVLCAELLTQAPEKGLFGLSYGLTLAEADSILALATFFPEESEKGSVKYYSDVNTFVEAILLFIEPKSKRLAGWFVKYDKNNGEDNDHLVIDRIANMHGENNHFDDETQQLIWFLSTTRSVHVMYSRDGSLTALYYDSHFPELFRLRQGELH